MKDKVKLTYYLYLDRSKVIRIRKNKYRLGDGELCIKLDIKVPVRFFKPPQIYKEISVNLPELPLIEPDIQVQYP